MCGPFAFLPGYETGEHRTIRCSASGDPTRLQTSLCLSSVSTGRVLWQLTCVWCFAGYPYTPTCEIQNATRGRL